MPDYHWVANYKTGNSNMESMTYTILKVTGGKKKKKRLKHRHTSHLVWAIDVGGNVGYGGEFNLRLYAQR